MSGISEAAVRERSRSNSKPQKIRLCLSETEQSFLKRRICFLDGENGELGGIFKGFRNKFPHSDIQDLETMRLALERLRDGKGIVSIRTEKLVSPFRHYLNKPR